MKWLLDYREKHYQAAYKRAKGVPESGVEAPLTASLVIAEASYEVENKKPAPTAEEIEKIRAVGPMFAAAHSLQEIKLLREWTNLTLWQQIWLKQAEFYEALDEGYSERAFDIIRDTTTTPHDALGQIAEICRTLRAERNRYWL